MVIIKGKTEEKIEIQVCRITVDAEIYDRIVANGVDEVDSEEIGFNIDKHSWHECQSESDAIVINVLVAEAFDDLAEGDFLRLEIRKRTHRAPTDEQLQNLWNTVRDQLVVNHIMTKDGAVEFAEEESSFAFDFMLVALDRMTDAEGLLLGKAEVS